MNDILTFFSMLKAILRRKYPMPWKTFFVGMLCLVYVLSPIDLFPDVLPLLGITDDATFLLLVGAMIQKDINKYRDSLKPPTDRVIDLGDIDEHKK